MILPRPASNATVIVMDQASVHTSAAIEDKLKEWDPQNIEIFWLPPLLASVESD